MIVYEDGTFGIIPTRVGTSKRRNYFVGYGQDHPHACGDKRRQVTLQYTMEGSSPRVWGQVLTNIMVDVLCRIIPTRVGTSFKRQLDFCVDWDHPHACGDKFFGDYTMATYVGSSPRVWGQAVISVAKASRPWIIPTRVGTRF